RPVRRPRRAGGRRLPGRPAAGLVLEQGRPQRGEPLLQLDRHGLTDGDAHVLAQLLLEAVALAAVRAFAQVGLRQVALGVRELSVEEGLQELLALGARIAVEPAVAHSPSTAFPASSRFRIRRPRCNRDMTVPTGMSRIWAASW